jgi:HEAT repeat protein
VDGGLPSAHRIQVGGTTGPIGKHHGCIGDPPNATLMVTSVGVAPPAPSNGGHSKLAHPELEFFLLSIVVEGYRPLQMLERESLGENVNRHVPDFTRDELVDILSDLFRCGDLIAHLGGTSRLHGGDPNVRPGMILHKADRSRPLCPSRDEIDGALCGALNLHYGLTPQGGARWEAMAQFDWNYHLGKWFGDGFEGPSREMIEVYLAYDDVAVAGSEQWSTVRPWKATYWKSIPEGVRVRYQDAPDDVRFARDWRERNLGGLWLDSWNERRRADMGTVIPMGPARSEIDADRPWRIQYRSVARRRTRDLLLLLDDADFAIQYAAGMRLAGLGDPPVAALIEWFLKRPTRFSLRVVSRLDNLRVLDALIDVLKTKDCKADSPDDTFQRDLGSGIGRFGAQSVPRLAPLLRVDEVRTQMAALRALGETGTVDAGTVILDWLHTLKGDGSAEREWLVRRALLALGKLSHLPALPFLKEILSGKVRCAGSRSAIEALALFNHSEARNLLEKFARSEANLKMRLSALSHLSKANPSFREEYERLHGEILLDTLRRETLDFLGGNPGLNVPDPIAPLVGKLNDPDPQRRVSAITLVCRHKGAFPAERVVELLEDAEPAVRANAVFALGLRGSGRHACKIQPLTHDSSGLVRYCAREALIRLNA